MKLLKVTLEYQEHTECLEGEDADEWLKAANGIALMSAVHGSPFPRFEWKTQKIAENERL